MALYTTHFFEPEKNKTIWFPKLEDLVLPVMTIFQIPDIPVFTG
jgi:hypothetical protein